MGRFIALLRAVNVAGHQAVPMADLRGLLTRLGYGSPPPQSLLASGNLVFEAAGGTGSKLEHILETESRKRLKLDTPFLVRTAAEWEAVVEGNPFSKEAKRDPGHLLVLFLKDPPDRRKVSVLQDAITGPEVVRAGARHLYITYPDGSGRSRLTNAVIERTLGTIATGRNWNTVMKLLTLVSG